MIHTLDVKPDRPSEPRGKRLAAADRKDLILAGARRAFSKSGDVRGTTIKQIAEESGISEGIIYRHFESKDDLFVQCAVEPLTDQINRTLEGFGKLDIDISGRDLNDLSVTYWTGLITSLVELSPLLGLVLFGDPAYAVPFYRDVLLPGLEKVNDDWAAAYERVTGNEYPYRYATLGHFGTGLMFAVHQRMADGPESIRAMAEEITLMEAHRLGLSRKAPGRDTAKTTNAKGSAAKSPARKGTVGQGAAAKRTGAKTSRK